MLKKIIQWSVTALTNVLIEKAARPLFSWIKRKWKLWKREKKNDKKVERYEDADSKKEQRDSFNDMP